MATLPRFIACLLYTSDRSENGKIENEYSKEVGKNLFNNEEIQRSVPQVFIDEIWSQMVKEGKCLPIDQSGRKSNNTTTTRYFILWKNLDNWASLILQWFEDSGKLNQVITLYLSLIHI